jgi:rhomboid protease GluP
MRFWENRLPKILVALMPLPTVDHLHNTQPDLIDQIRQQTPYLPVTVLLVFANLAVFAAMLLNGAGLWHAPNNVQLAWGANFGPATEDGQWWRLGSAMFLHFGVIHLALNMIALWEAGRLVERMVGHLCFAAIYLLSGLSGSLLSLVAHGNSAVSGGASGAIFGLYGALLVALLLRRRQLNPREFRWLFWGAAAFSALTIALGMLIPGIDNATHFGGLITGILGGIALAPPSATEVVWRRRRSVAAAVWMALLAGLSAAIPPPKYRWSEEQQARGRINEFLGEDQQISAQWSAILERGRNGKESFQELASQIESAVTTPYDASFAQLSAVPLSPQAPSAATLELLRNYSEARRDAAQELVAGLRSEDPRKIGAALEKARRAAEAAQEQSAHPKPGKS